MARKNRMSKREEQKVAEGEGGGGGGRRTSLPSLLLLISLLASSAHAGKEKLTSIKPTTPLGPIDIPNEFISPSNLIGSTMFDRASLSDPPSTIFAHNPARTVSYLSVSSRFENASSNNSRADVLSADDDDVSSLRASIVDCGRSVPPPPPLAPIIDVLVVVGRCCCCRRAEAAAAATVVVFVDGVTMKATWAAAETVASPVAVRRRATAATTEADAIAVVERRRIASLFGVGSPGLLLI